MFFQYNTIKPVILPILNLLDLVKFELRFLKYNKKHVWIAVKTKSFVWIFKIKSVSENMLRNFQPLFKNHFIMRTSCNDIWESNPGAFKKIFLNSTNLIFIHY